MKNVGMAFLAIIAVIASAHAFDTRNTQQQLYRVVLLDR